MMAEGGICMKDVSFRDADAAFDDAIKKGMKDPENWMYMYSDEEKDYFKNIDTREYKAYSR